MTFRVDNVVTSGLFKLDGGEWEVDNNVWIVGDDSEVYIIDAAHDVDIIVHIPLAAIEAELARSNRAIDTH